MIGEGGGGFMAGSIVARLLLDKGGFDQGMTEVRRQTEMMAEGAKRAAGSLSGIGMKMAAAGAAVVGMATLAVASFTRFDDAMKQSLAIMGDLSDALKEDLTKAARDVSRITTFSANQAAGAYYFLASAGMSAKESMEALPVVAKFAQAGMFGLEEATTLLADAQTALGMRIRDDAVKNMEEMTRVSDVLSKANILANASIQQFSEALTTRAGSALRLVGKDIEEGAAVLAVFANSGVKGAEAGTRLDIVLRDLQTRAIKNKDVFAKFNVEVFDQQGEMKNLADIFQDLEEAMAGMSDEERRATLMAMEFQDRSVASILALVGNSAEIRRYEAELQKAGGTTEEIAKKQLESLKSQLKLTKNELENLADAIGSTLAPAVAKIGELVKGATKFFADMTDGNKEVVGALVGVTVAVGALTLALGLGIMAAGTMITQWAVLTTMAPGVAMALTMVASVLGGLLGGVLAVAVGFAAWKFGEWIGKVTGLNKVIQGAAGGVIWLAQQVGLARKPVDELEVSELRLARRHLFLATASAVAGKEITNLVDAVQILKAEYAAKGTVGDTSLDKWLATVTAAKSKVDGLKGSIQGLNGIFPGLGDRVASIGSGLKDWLASLPGVTKWWGELGKTMKGMTPEAKAAEEAIRGIFEKYDVKKRSDIELALKQAESDLKLLRTSAEATPEAIQAVTDKINEYREALSGWGARAEKVGAEVEYLNTRIKALTEQWEKAAGVDFGEFGAWLKRGGEFEIDVQLKLEEDTWEESMKGWETVMSRTKDTASDLLNDLTRDAAEAAAGSSKAIADAIRGMIEGGSLAEVKLRIAEITQVLSEMGGTLTTERIRELQDELTRLKGIVADSTPWGRFVDAAQRAVAKVAEAWSYLSSSFAGVIQQAQQNTEIEIENEYKMRLDYINRTITDEDRKQKAIVALEAEYEIKKSKARATAAKQEKAMNLMNAVVNTAVAITSALKVFPPWLGIALAAVVGAMGAVQIGLIASQPIPLAEGASFMQPTVMQNVLTGEKGPEHMLREERLVDIVQTAMTKPRFTAAPAMAAAWGGGGGNSYAVNCYITPQGLTRADIVPLAEEVAYQVDRQLKRIGGRR